MQHTFFIRSKCSTYIRIYLNSIGQCERGLNPAVGVEKLLWDSPDEARDGKAKDLERAGQRAEDEQEAGRDAVVELEHKVVGGGVRGTVQEAPERGQGGNQRHDVVQDWAVRN